MPRRRITVKSFIDAVKKTGVVPRRCLWIKPGTDTVEACAIGALAVAEVGAKSSREATRYARSAEGLGLTGNYITGFITGFDGGKQRPRWTEEHELGYEDGYACAVAAFDEKLHERYEVRDVDDLTPYFEPPDEAEENWLYRYN